MSKMKQTMAVAIHIGDNTQIHDQLMIRHNLRVIKTIVSKPQKPMPPEDDFESISLFG
ncbi:MAG: hypothetical protein KGL39_10055 [Patescibacteria group bacterium]|nr:hypothetical protein [Patescibacteria group bacterium]